MFLEDQMHLYLHVSIYFHFLTKDLLKQYFKLEFKLNTLTKYTDILIFNFMHIIKRCVMPLFFKKLVKIDWAYMTNGQPQQFMFQISSSSCITLKMIYPNCLND